MAATGFTPIQLYHSTTASAAPSAGNLAAGELAVNITDGKLFYKDNGGVVQVLASKGAGTIGGSNTQVQYNSGGALAGSSNLTFDGTSLTLGGNPTLSAGTANGVAYLNGSKVLTTGSALTFDGTKLGVGTATPAGLVEFNQTADADCVEYITARAGNARSAALLFRTNTSGGAGTGGGIGHNGSQLILNANGASLGTQFVLDSSGNLGLGVTPSAVSTNSRVMQVRYSLFEDNLNGYSIWRYNDYFDGTSDKYIVNGSAQALQMQGGAFKWYTAPSGTAGNPISFTQAMTLDASGNLLVGTASGTNHKLVKNSSDGYAVTVENSTTGNPYGLNIVYSGKSGLSTVNELYIKCQDTTATRMYVCSNGGIANYQANNANLSDIREKTNFAPAGEYLSKICAIPVQTYNYIDQNLEKDPGLTLGVVAQDVQAVAPELVMESNWGTEDEPKMRLSVYQTDLQYALMKCIQEQQALIVQLQADVAALKGAA